MNTKTTARPGGGPSRVAVRANQFLMGSETEYSVCGQRGDQQVPPEQLFKLLHSAVRQEQRWMPDARGGQSIYLENAGRLYLDTGAHPEYATPECFTPAQVACYDKAGELILGAAQARVLREQPGLELSVIKNNIGPIFPDRDTWGSHESHLCWTSLERVAPQIIPHLVSRVMYAGAGCLSADNEGMGFELSQRARHIVQVTGSDTTCNRAILCTRIRQPSDHSSQGWVRAHLISKDSQRAPLGIYLTFGITAVLFLIMNEKRKVGTNLTLSDPVRALHTFSRDPWLRARVPLADGRQLTALEIQESYLAECEQQLQGGGFPDWTRDVLRHARETIEMLGRDPLLLAPKLDPYCKLLMYDHEIRRAGYDWSDLHKAMQSLSALRAAHPVQVVRAVLAEDPKSLPSDTQAAFVKAMKTAGAKKPGGLDRIRFAGRLQMLELNYHELGGIFDRLAAAGHVQNVILDRNQVEHAMREPPPGGRAAVRAGCIKSCRETGWVCDWRYLFHVPSQTYVDLRNPFETTRKTLRGDPIAPNDSQIRRRAYAIWEARGRPDLANWLQAVRDLRAAREGGRIVHAWFSRDGNRLLCEHEADAFRLWEAESGDLLSVYAVRRTRLPCVDERLGDLTWAAPSPGPVRQCRLVDAACGPSPVREYHVAGQEEYRNDIQQLAVSEDGGTVAIAVRFVHLGSCDSVFSRLLLWQPATGESRELPNQAWAGIRVLRFSPAGDSLLCGGGSSRSGCPALQVLSTRDGRALWSEGLARDASRSCPTGAKKAAWRRDGAGFAAFVDDRLWIVDLAAGGSVRELDCGGIEGDLAFSPDGSRLAAWRRDRVLVWQLDSGAQALDLPFAARVLAVCFAPDASHVRVAREEGPLCVPVASRHPL